MPCALSVAEAFLDDLQVTDEGYNNGKNFSLDDLIFRIKTDADYRYAENDDLPETEGLRLTALEKLRDEYDALKQSRVKDINIRKKKILGTRNLPLRLVYAHIANYTQVKGAWCGTQRDLAAQLELPIATVSDKLSELIDKGHIVRDANNYRSAHEQICSAGEQNCSAPVQICSAGEQNCSAGEQNSTPTPPINNKINNNKMRNNENIARDTIATPNPTNLSSFERLLFFYRKRVGNCQLSEATINDSRNLWEKFPLWKRLRLFEVLNDPNGWFRPRLDWTLSAFNPQPVNLNGTSEGGMKLASGEAKTAFYNGSYGIYSLRDIQDFALKEPHSADSRDNKRKVISKK